MAETRQDAAAAAWGIEADFGDARAEWHAARTACAVAEAPFRARLAARGEDRRGFLQGMLSNDVKNLAEGRGVHAAFLTDSAKVVADMRVYAEPERFVLECLSWCRERLQSGLERYLVADDVELEVQADDQPLLIVEGPASAEVLRAVLGGAPALPEEEYAHVRLDGGLAVARVSEVAGNGFAISGPPARREPLLAACREAGAVRLGARALSSLRLEAGVPWSGVDMDEDVLVMEMDLASALSFTKGCYLGQETVERVGARGHVNRLRTGFVLESDALPVLPAAVRAGDKEVGRITSAAHSFLLGRQVGLGLLHIKAKDAGPLEIVSEGRAIACRAASLPLSAGE